ncbi:hypothetical protein JCM19232_4983 [Vibrio ishigakensis]|uniref:Toxin co-regulated pilus biosynthesis protein Q C-terminal domain-containing protein n=1 Tax=Vibrio ishigakensis TaxID=1481914 RepID=A0A0B8PQS4_9VIBR|nr:hypothetical protein JCM19232_4983 [Vibrio ishigakensis]
MKTLPVLLLGGLLTSVCWAAPSGHMDDGTLTITGLPTPPPPIEAEPEPLLLDSDIRAPEPKTVIKRPKRSNEKTVLAPHKPITYTVNVGERPYHALVRWADKNHYQKMAFTLSDEQKETLLEPATRPLNFTGNLNETVNELGKHLKLPLRFTGQRRIAGIHTLEGPVDVVWIHGSTVKEAAINLTKHYQWHWLTHGPTPSWLAPDNYPLASDYGLVVPKGAFDLALDNLLEGYPVQAYLVMGSRTAFIRERS